jgi:type VI secretion system secreted protein VgrG
MPDGSVSQRTRLGKFHSPLGPDALALVRFDGDEGINQLGSFRVDVLSPTGIVDLDAVLGLYGTVEITTLRHGPRFYDGIIAEAELVEERADGWLAQLVLRPWFWLAGLRRNQRIFHNRTAPQIIAAVLKDYAHVHEARLRRSYQPVEYTVQYGESDMAFVCRMMEHHGLSYHFEHALAGHVMVLTDAMESFRAAPGGSRIYQQVARQHRVEDEHFSIWSAARRVNTGRVRLTDYNFKTPTAAMPVDLSGGAVHAEGEIESYDYPGHYLAQGAGRAVARMRAEKDRAADGLFVAKGDTASLSPGMLVTLTNHPDAGLNGKQYILRNATHSYVAEAYASSGAAAESDDDSYKGSYTFHPQATPFRPAMITPLARIYGPQTAVVVGEGEIDCDEYGRILVRFHWDLLAAHSMRCRVAQIWAGNGWGGMVIPRIGMEVLVEFLEGDPDKPLVTGCVYNGKNKVPYALPEHKTRSSFKTDTHQGNGFNELRFEDAMGEEEIFVHAQKDMNVDVLDTHTKHVVNNDVEMVENNKISEVNRNFSQAIGGSMSIHVGPTHIGRFVSQGLFSLVEKLGGYSKRFGLPGLLDPTAGNLTITVEKHALEAVGLTSVHTVGLNDSVFVGKTSKLNAGKEIKMAAGELVRITCGKSTIEMKGNGEMTLNGDKININAATMVKINGKVVDIN